MVQLVVLIGSDIMCKLLIRIGSADCVIKKVGKAWLFFQQGSLSLTVGLSSKFSSKFCLIVERKKVKQIYMYIWPEL